MTQTTCCGMDTDEKKKNEFETIKIEKINRVCPMCENYSKEHEKTPVAVMCCEGACLRGEIARQAANMICHRLEPEKTVRICLGGAFTKDTGQRNLVRNAGKLIALDGCFLECSTRMMKGVIPDLTPKTIIADSLYEFDRSLFGINEMPEDEIKFHAKTVAENVIKQFIL